MASNQYDAQASTNYKEAFSLFDKRGNGRVALDSLGDLLRACGQNPTLNEIRDLEKNVGGDCECGQRARGGKNLRSRQTVGGYPPHRTTALLTTFCSRFRDLPARPQPARRLPRPRRARRVLPRLPGLRQGHDGLHRRRPAQVHPDKPGREDDGRGGRGAAKGGGHELGASQLHRYVTPSSL